MDQESTADERASIDLVALLTTTAAHIAAMYGCPRAATTRMLLDYVADASIAYHAAGTPLGNDDAGFIVWLLESWPPA
jgi:hypothetical protein